MKFGVALGRITETAAPARGYMDSRALGRKPLIYLHDRHLLAVDLQSGLADSSRAASEKP